MNWCADVYSSMAAGRMWSRVSVGAASPGPFLERVCPSRWFRPAFLSRCVLKSSGVTCWSWPGARIEGRAPRGLIRVPTMRHRHLRRVRVSIVVLAPLTMRRGVSGTGDGVATCHPSTVVEEVRGSLACGEV